MCTMFFVPSAPCTSPRGAPKAISAFAHVLRKTVVIHDGSAYALHDAREIAKSLRVWVRRQALPRGDADIVAAVDSIRAGMDVVVIVADVNLLGRILPQYAKHRQWLTQVFDLAILAPGAIVCGDCVTSQLYVLPKK